MSVVITAFQAAPKGVDLDPFHDAADKRDRRAAARATGLHFKIAAANLLPIGMSDAARCRHGEENSQNYVLHSTDILYSGD